MDCRVVVVGDSVLGVQGVVHLLPPGANLLGTSSSLRFFEEKVEQLKPELLIVALAQPSIGWTFSLVRLAERLASQIVVLTPETTVTEMPPALTPMALSGLTAEEITQLLEQVIKNNKRANREMEGAKLEAAFNISKVLSDREVEVLKLVTAGLSTKEIAAQLCISTRTVDFHRANIQSKTGVKSVATLTRYAIEQKLAEARPNPALTRIKPQ